MRLLGILVLLMSIGRFLMPIMDMQVEAIANLPAWSWYFGSLIGGFLIGLGSVENQIRQHDNDASKRSVSTDMSYCPNQKCGHFVKSDQQFCTACGTIIDKPVRRTEHCANPACSKPVDTGRKFCTACGWPIGKAGKKEKVNTRKVRRCSNSSCGQQTDAKIRFCTVCGAPMKTEVRETAAPESFERRCPNPQCVQLMPEDKTFCTACGVRVL